MHIEIELKLAIERHHIPKLIQMPLLANALDHETVTLHSTYFDTSDRILRNNGYVLRIRHDEKKRYQTIKTRNSSRNKLQERHEWEHEINQDLPQLENFPDESLRQQLLTLPSTNPLKPLFTTEFVRSNWILAFAEKTKIQLSLDQGFVIAGSRRAPISEIELELITGEKNHIHHLADTLCQAIPSLKPIDGSKAGLGYQLSKKG